MGKLPKGFYCGSDVISIARQLLGKVLVTRIGGELTSGMIVETEAYRGVTDRASHAWAGRRTDRTEIMFGRGGKAYVYLCYGIHHLFNIVTNQKEIPHAILIRALEPVQGIDVMLRRAGKEKPDRTLTGGPGSLSRALGIDHRLHSGESLNGKKIWIREGKRPLKSSEIAESTRVGVSYAGADAYRPWRFYIRGNPWVSRGKGLGPVEKIKGQPGSRLL